jgi:hypothetical protein
MPSQSTGGRIGPAPSGMPKVRPVKSRAVQGRYSQLCRKWSVISSDESARNLHEMF